MFEDRRDAGRQLADRLREYRGETALILALPRGGVVVADEVAKALNAPLDVIVARKIGAPWQPELGIGAIAPGGVRLLDESTLRMLRIRESEIEPIIQSETAEMERRLREYRGDRPEPEMAWKTVILVDDGLATGVTARAALRSIRQKNPRKIVLAVPVCARETAHVIAEEVNELVCVAHPADFRAVGFWYRDFDQTSDQEVIDILRQDSRAPAPV